MKTHRHRRRRLVIVVLVAVGIAAVTTYRDRSLRRSASEFVARYGD